MATSMARAEANRRNSLKSTGPKTEAGKTASRMNAFQHGMAGNGDLIGPGEDEALVARRAEAFARELGASGAMGWLLAHRAALLSVRMENLAAGEMVAVRAAERAGRAAFDADRVDAIQEVLAEATEPGADPTPALEALVQSPDGLAGLVAAWADLLVLLGSAEPGDAREVAARWLGLTGDDDENENEADLVPSVKAEIARLQSKLGTMAAEARAIERARTDAGTLARFDPGPEATLARRYEAAAERGMYRAIRSIAEINRNAGRTLDEANLVDAVPSLLNRDRKPTSPPPPRVVETPLASFRAGVVEPLASFRAGVVPPAKTAPVVVTQPVIMNSLSVETRKKRPDLRKLQKKLAASRR